MLLMRVVVVVGCGLYTCMGLFVECHNMTMMISVRIVGQSATTHRHTYTHTTLKSREVNLTSRVAGLSVC